MAAQPIRPGYSALETRARHTMYSLHAAPFLSTAMCWRVSVFQEHQETELVRQPPL
jgi:hypothetical protein